MADLCSAVALLYMGPAAASDEYVVRLRAAMEAEDMDEMEHVTALMLTILSGRGKLPQDVMNRWLEVFGG